MPPLIKKPKPFFLLLALTSFPLVSAEIQEGSISLPFSWSVSDRALMTSAQDPGDPEAPAKNILSHQATLGASYSSWSTQVAFTNRLSQDQDPQIDRPFVLDKKSLVGEGENWEVRLGDSYQEFGRGIALALFNNPVFGVDNSLEGASAKIRWENGEVLGFGGRVNALEAPVAINPLDSLTVGRQVLIGGGALSALWGKSKISSHYHLTTSQPDGQPVNRKYQTLGLQIESRDLLPGVDAYFESNVMDWEAARYKQELQAKPRAYASFASLSYSDINLKTKIEAKDYRDFFYDFQRPPTLEEDIVLATNNSDVSAVRVQTEGRLGEERQVSLGSSFLTGQDRELKTAIYHPLVFSKIKLQKGLDVELRGGYRWMPEKNDLAHASLKTKMKTYKGQYLELELRKQNLRQAISSPIPILEERNAALTTYTFSEKFNLGVGYEYMPTNLPELGNHFLNASATYQTGLLTARAFVGQTSGGTQCSSGVCRQVPPYTGAYLETSLSF